MALCSLSQILSLLKVRCAPLWLTGGGEHLLVTNSSMCLVYDMSYHAAPPQRATAPVDNTYTYTG